MRQKIFFILCAFLLVQAVYAWQATVETTVNTNCKGVAVPTSLFEVKFGKKHVYDVYRNPPFPRQGQGITITVHSMPYRSEGDTITAQQWREGYYMGLADRGRVGDLDRTNPDQRAVYNNVHNSAAINDAGVVIDDIRLVSTALFDQDGNLVEYIGKYGVLWGLSQYGFLFVDYTSWRELGTFYFIDEVSRLGAVLNYIPDYTLITSIDVITNFFEPEEVAHSSCTGKAMVQLPDDSVHYTFQWNDPMLQTTCTALNLCAGSYQVVVTDTRDGSSSTLLGNVEANSPVTQLETVSLFANDKVVVGGREYTEPGNYSVLIPASETWCGCDSTVQFTIVRANVERSVVQDCLGNVVELPAPAVAGQPLWSTGETGQTILVEATPNAVEYTCTVTQQPDPQTGRTVVAVITYVVSAYSSQPIEENASICAGQSYTFNGVEYSEAGTYTGTYTTQNGCEVAYQLVLTVNQAPLVDQGKQSICQGQTYNFNGTLLSESGTYSQTYTTEENCQGQVKVDLQVNPTYHLTYSHQIQAGQVYAFQGQSLTQSGSYTAYNTTRSGCDSITVLQLTVLRGEFEIPLFFSPNGDGLHDTWRIKGIDSSVEVYIYNRYDVCLATYKGNFTEWDGMYNGHPLPADDYWYVLIDNKENKKYSGHVTLKR